MVHPTPPDNFACRLLKLEQQLKAYEALHAGELAELWQNLNECKQALTNIILSDESTCPKDATPLPTELRHPENET